MAADTTAPPKGAGSGLTRKVGPLPVFAWALIGFGVYYWYTHYGPGASSGAAGTANATPGPAVTIGNISQSIRGGAGTAGSTTTTGGTVKVPAVVGKTDTAGDAAIIKAGLKVHDVNEKKGGSGGGTKITAQSPAAGTMVAPGSTVSVTLGTPARKTAAKTSKTTPKGKTVRSTSAAAGQPNKGVATTVPPIAPGGTVPPVTPGTTTTTKAGTAGETGSNAVNVNVPGQGYQYAPTGGPVSADTGDPVYWEWMHAHRGPEVPEPVFAYAPATNGATYGPAVDVGPPGQDTTSVSQSLG